MYDFDTPVEQDTTLEAQYLCLERDAVVLTQLSGSGTIYVKNKWQGPLYVTFQDGTERRINSTSQTSFACTEDMIGGTIRISAEKSTFEKWITRTTGSVPGIVYSTTSSSKRPRFSISVPSLEPFLIDGTRAGDNFFGVF